jgi:hypothetical protein
MLLCRYMLGLGLAAAACSGIRATVKTRSFLEKKTAVDFSCLSSRFDDSQSVLPARCTDFILVQIWQPDSLDGPIHWTDTRIILLSMPAFQ